MACSIQMLVLCTASTARLEPFRPPLELQVAAQIYATLQGITLTQLPVLLQIQPRQTVAHARLVFIAPALLFVRHVQRERTPLLSRHHHHQFACLVQLTNILQQDLVRVIIHRLHVQRVLHP